MSSLRNALGQFEQRGPGGLEVSNSFSLLEAEDDEEKSGQEDDFQTPRVGNPVAESTRCLEADVQEQSEDSPGVRHQEQSDDSPGFGGCKPLQLQYTHGNEKPPEKLKDLKDIAGTRDFCDSLESWVQSTQRRTNWTLHVLDPVMDRMTWHYQGQFTRAELGRMQASEGLALLRSMYLLDEAGSKGESSDYAMMKKEINAIEKAKFEEGKFSSYKGELAARYEPVIEVQVQMWKIISRYAKNDVTGKFILSAELCRAYLARLPSVVEEQVKLFYAHKGKVIMKLELVFQVVDSMVKDLAKVDVESGTISVALAMFVKDLSMKQAREPNKTPAKTPVKQAAGGGSSGGGARGPLTAKDWKDIPKDVQGAGCFRCGKPNCGVKEKEECQKKK